MDGFSCGIKTNGFLACWGDNASQRDLIRPPNGTFQEVSSGYKGSCAIKIDGTPNCWGTESFNDGINTPRKKFEKNINIQFGMWNYQRHAEDPMLGAIYGGATIK